MKKRNYLILCGLLAVSGAALAADPCSGIYSGNSVGTYTVYYPSQGTTCVWTYNPKIARQDTLIDMVGTVNNGHLQGKSVAGISLNSKGEISKVLGSGANSCANGATVEFFGTCVNGKLDLTLMQVSVPATGDVLGTTLIGNGKFQSNSSTFSFRVNANQ